jgi:hypothetical protein
MLQMIGGGDGLRVLRPDFCAIAPEGIKQKSTDNSRGLTNSDISDPRRVC